MKKVELLQLVDQLSGTPVGHEYEMAVFKAGRELIRQATELAELTNRLHDANQSVGNLEANISALKGQKPVFYINQDSLSAFKDGAKGWGTVWTVKHGDYKVPLYPAPGAQPYDQQALELCEACGWKAIIPGERCLVCERNDALAAGAQAKPSDYEIHKAHCYQAPYETSCKYGDDDCPMQADAALWLKKNRQAPQEPTPAMVEAVRPEMSWCDPVGIFKKMMQAGARPVQSQTEVVHGINKSSHDN